MLPEHIYAQTPCPNDNNFANSFPAPACAPGSTVGVGAGTYVEFQVITGASYTFSTCGTNGSWDPQITGYQGSGVSPLFAADDNGPLCGGLDPSIVWVSTFTGTLRLVMDISGCDPCDAAFLSTPTDCPSLGSAVLTYMQNDNITITSSSSLMCAGEQRTLTATPAGGAFSGTGVVGSTFTAPDENQTYNISYTFGQCTKTQNIQVVRNPTVVIDGDAIFCSGGDVILSANVTSPGGGSPSIISYQWKLNGNNVGGNSSQYTALVGGDYTVVVTNSNGCTGTSPVKQITASGQGPTVSISGNPGFCPGGSVTLTANAQAGSGSITSHQWFYNGGSLGAAGSGMTYNATQAGSYTVQVVNSDGCSTLSAPFSLTEYAVPSVTILGNDEICPGPGHSINLTSFASAGSGTITNRQWKRDGVNVGTNSSSYTATQAGTYTLVVTNSNGCSEESADFVISELTAPVVAITGPSGYCTGETINLVANATGGSGFNYQWKLNGNNVGVNNQTLSAVGTNPLTIGNYSVVVTNSNGCSTESAVKPISEFLVPAVFITGDDEKCPGESILLTGQVSSSGTGVINSYQWKESGNNIFNATQETYNASQAGNYQIVVTNTSGCTRTSAVHTITDLPAPAVTITGSTSLCTGQSVLLTANAAGFVSFQWKLNGGNLTPGGNGSTYSATFPGTYTVVATNLDGCSTESAGHLIASSGPVVAILGGDGFCPGGNVLLTASATPAGGTTITNYQWKLNGSNVGTNNSTYTATQGGNYTVVVTGSDGCSTESPVKVITAGETPTVTISGDDDLCVGGGTIVLTANVTGGPISIYQWKLNGNPVGTSSPNYTATQAGNYTVEVTNSAGCSATSAIKGITATQGITVTVSGETSLCVGGSVLLTANATGGTITTFQWKLDGGNVGTNNSTFTATQAGNYTVEATASNGCSAESVVHVVSLSQSPTVSISGNTGLCAGDSIVLTATASGGVITSRQWKLNGVNVGTDSDTYTATAAGNYTVVVTNSNGCATESSVHTIVAGQSFTVAISGNPETCSGDTVLLTASTSGTGIAIYQWKLNGGNVGGNSNTIAASLAGDYTVVATDSSGCSAESAIHTLSLNDPPTASITGTSLFCVGESSVLTANATAGSGTIVSYQWKRNGSNVGTNSDTYTATLSGNYTVEVTNSNNCYTLSASFTVAVILAPTVSITDSSGPCAGDSIYLTAIATAGSGSITSYQWTLDSNDVGINSSTHSSLQTGNYTVVVRNSDGCSTESSVLVVAQNQPPSVVITGDTGFCKNDSILLTAVATPGDNPVLTFQWKRNGVNVGVNSSTYFAKQTGDYTVEVTDAAGCSAESPIKSVDEFQLPTASITGPGVVCTADSVVWTVTATAGSGSITSFQWLLNGITISAIGDTLITDDPGDYTVIVVNSHGCSSQTTKRLLEIPVPNVGLITGDSTLCGVDSVLLTVSATAGSGTIVSHQWKLNGTNVGTNSSSYGAKQAGDYTVVVTNSNGCSTESAVKSVSGGGPDCNISGENEICLGDSTIFTASGASASGVYSWVGPGGFSASGASTGYITTPGRYTVTIVDSGCFSTCFRTLVVDSCINDTSCVTQDIDITIGWNMISSYIDPDNPDMLDVVSAISSDIVIIKNVQGQSAIPSFGINTIGDWQVEEGYKLKSLNDNILSMSCDLVDPTVTPINLPVGWSIISYLRTTPMNAITALSSLTSDNVVIVKNIAGNSYIPSFGINTIGNLLPGQGYSIKMVNPDVLTYPANAKSSTSGFYTKVRQPAYFRLSENTAHNATIIVPASSISGIKVGDEIGVFNEEGLLTGSAVYEGHHLAITVWGDDPTTDQFENMLVGDEFNVKVWRPGLQSAIVASAEFENNNRYYQHDGVSIMKKLTLDQSLIDKQDIHVTCYPNPTSGIITFRFETSAEAEAALFIYDMVGKVIAQRVVKVGEADGQEYKHDASNLARGIYFYKAEVNGNFFNGSFVVDR